MKPFSERSLLLLLAAVQFTHIMDFMIMMNRGWIVAKQPSGQLTNFHWLGWMAVSAGLVSIWLASRVRVNESDGPTTIPAKPDAPSLNSSTHLTAVNAFSLKSSTIN